jgi:peptidyl-prolyl cis-trans isomerase B (cyclophilin B)
MLAMRFSLLALVIAAAVACAPAAAAQMPERTTPPEPAAPLPETNLYAIETSLGRIVVRLFDETPIHRDNFKRLVQEAFYDSTTFHRVIQGFMIQGGDPNTRDTIDANDGLGDPGYSVPAEIGRLHFRGALAAARQPDQINPLRASSGSQFYIVQGPGPIQPAVLERMRASAGTGVSYTPEDVARYAEVGGTPPLDGGYTVFGEVVEGMEVVDAIAASDTPRQHGDAGPWADRPVEAVRVVVRPVVE